MLKVTQDFVWGHLSRKQTVKGTGRVFLYPSTLFLECNISKRWWNRLSLWLVNDPGSGLTLNCFPFQRYLHPLAIVPFVFYVGYSRFCGREEAGWALAKVLVVGEVQPTQVRGPKGSLWEGQVCLWAVPPSFGPSPEHLVRSGAVLWRIGQVIRWAT